MRRKCSLYAEVLQAFVDALQASLGLLEFRLPLRPFLQQALLFRLQASNKLGSSLPESQLLQVSLAHMKLPKLREAPFSLPGTQLSITCSQARGLKDV